jgi:hypothetical protein
MRTRLFSLLILFSVANYAKAAIEEANGYLRVILPPQEEIYNGTQPGELAWNSYTGTIVVSKGIQGQFVDLNGKENLPPTVKIGNTISIKSGSAYIGDTFVSVSPMTCSYSIAGLGGYEGTVPTNPQIGYLYLVLETISDPWTPKVNCIISTSSTGPAQSPYSTFKWRRLYSFWTTAEFMSSAETVFYSANSDTTFSITSPTACTTLTNFKVSTSSERARIRLNCNTAGSSNYRIYTDPFCSQVVGSIACSSTATQPSWLDYNPTQILYYKGTVGAVQTINLIEATESSKVSTSN